MATLQQVVDQVQDVVAALSGIRAAPHEPPEKLSVYPFAVCQVQSGSWYIGPPEVMTGVHTLLLDVHVARKDMARDVQTAMVYAKMVPNALFKAFVDGTLTALETFETIDYSFGRLAYGDTETVGWRFSIRGVKTQDEIT